MSSYTYISTRFAHIVIAEKVLGGSLPKGAQVHHVNGNGKDNSPGNLVICENQAYHRLLHRRANALAAYGNVNARQCEICKEWDVPETNGMKVYPKPKYSAGRSGHAACYAQKTLERKHNSKA